MNLFNLILISIFGITIIPPQLLQVPIKYGIIIPLLFLVIYNSIVLPKFVRSKEQVLFSQSIYLYLFGMLISALISGNGISSTIIYTFLFLLRFIIIERVCRKIDFFTIFDSAALGVSISLFICILTDYGSRILFQKFFTFQITNIAYERLTFYGTQPNFIGVSAGIIFLYVAVRIVNDQYEKTNEFLTDTKLVNYSSFYGYLILIFNFIVLFLSNTRSAYLSILLALLFQFLIFFKRKRFFNNKNNRFYIFLMTIVIINFNKFITFLDNYITISSNRYRGISSGLAGRIDRWQEKISLIGPIGYGYSPNIKFDNNYLYSAYSSGLLFSIPLFIFYFYFFLKLTKETMSKDIDFLYRLELNIKISLSIFLFIHLFLDQQTIGQTSLISFIFIILPISFSSKNRNNVDNNYLY